MSGLHVEGLRKSYGRQLAVDDVSFDVAPGEIVGFVGPNGAGKSTTLRLITGLLRPDAGTVRLDGIDLRTGPAAFRARLGALIEAPAMYPMLTALAHLQYVARLHRLRGLAHLRETLSAVGLDPDGKKTVRQFSLGMKQRLGIAMAIFSRPSLLVLDEPMNGLDPSGIAELRAFIRTLPARLGGSVLVSSHLLSELERTCDRVVFIRDGRIVGNTRLAAAASQTALGAVLIRTGDDTRAFAILREASFIVEAVAEPSGGVRCTLATSDVPLVAPLLVRHEIPLLELTEARAHLEAAYLAHFTDRGHRGRS